MTVLLNRVRQAINAPTGTGGPLQLSSSAFTTMYATVANAGAADGDIITYIIEEGNDFEIQRGAWTLSSNQLARNTPYMTCISGSIDLTGASKMSLAGTATIRVVGDAGEFSHSRGLRTVVGATDTLLSKHSGMMTAYNRSTSIAVAIAAPGTNSFRDGWYHYVKNIGAGAVTITASSATITSDGQSTSAITLQQNEGTVIFSDGLAYYALIVRQSLWLAQTLTSSQKAQARANIDVERKNYVINGAMMVSQENGTTSGSGNAFYPVDKFFSTQAGNAGTFYSLAQNITRSPAGSTNRIRLTVSAVNVSPAAGDLIGIQQRIEGFRVADLLFGGGAAKTITLQFGVRAPAGTYYVSFRNNAGDRSYVVPYTIASGEANTDVVKSVTIPGDITGTWLTDNSIGLAITWALLAGSTWQGSASSWQSGNLFSASGAANLFTTNGQTFDLFDVGLYEGTVAPTFIVPNYVTELALCKRYFQKFVNPSDSIFLSGYNSASAQPSQCFFYPVEMRAAPTTAVLGTWTVANSSQPAFFGVGPKAFNLFVTVTALGAWQCSANNAGNGISLNARL